jgi:hypothetical protein
MSFRNKQQKPKTETQKQQSKNRKINKERQKQETKKQKKIFYMSKKREWQGMRCAGDTQRE